jgi:hypothetical protein
MPTCPKCSSSVPEGMRFCLQCGSALAAPAAAEKGIANFPRSSAAPPAPAPGAAVGHPPPPVSAPVDGAVAAGRPHPSPRSTVALKISPSPLITPRGNMPVETPRPSLGGDIAEVDEEALKKAFQKPVAQPGTVVCRFCKGPLDLAGDFCEQCGAPVAEAMPPGTVRPQPPTVAAVKAPPQAAPESESSITPHPQPSEPLGAAAPGQSPTAPVPNVAKPAAPAATPRPAPAAPRTPLRPHPAPEPPSGLMGRLKDVLTRDMFKKS